MWNTFKHMMVTLPIIIGVIVYFNSIDDIRSEAAKDFSEEAAKRGYMVQCDGFDGYYWEC